MRMNRKPEAVLLLTRDFALQQEAARAAAASRARLIVAGNVGEALQIISERGGELGLVVSDLDDAVRGMVLLSALSGHSATPLVALTSTPADHSAALGYPNDAACRLTKPTNALEFEMMIRLLAQPVRESRKRSQKMRRDSQLTRGACQHRYRNFSKPSCKQNRSQLHQHEHNNP
jgi:DNA-binding response OmpR family regulator